jgi:hypothetical protein
MYKENICHIDFSKKRLYTAFTPPEIASPDRHPQQCGMAFLTGHSCRSHTDLSKSLFPDEVIKPDGFILRRPKTWQ